MAEIDTLWMQLTLGHPQDCHEDVTRGGISQPCDKTAVALRIDPEEQQPYTVCAHHARGEMVSLEAIVRFFLDRDEAQRVVARGIVRMAEGDDDGD